MAERGVYEMGYVLGVDIVAVVVWYTIDTWVIRVTRSPFRVISGFYRT